MAGWQIDEPVNLSGLPHAYQQPNVHTNGGSQPASKQPSQPSSQACSKPGTPPLPPIVPQPAGQQSSLLPFRTYEPRTREQRRAEVDKFAKEKSRIAQRNPFTEPPPDDVVTPLPQTSMYMDTSLRFACRDAAAAEHERKQLTLQKKEAMYNRKRQEHYMREALSWHRNQAACDRGDTIATAKREAGQGGARRNMGGTSYNILTLDYASTPSGEALRKQDSIARYKANLRSNMLYSKNHSTGFNIISGEPAWKPAEVRAPWERPAD